MKILLLEPSKSQRMVFQALVESDYHIEWHISADLNNDIVNELQEQVFDVIVTAKELKNCGYEEVLDAIYQTQVNEETPVFLLSSSRDSLIHKQAFNQGVTGILDKNEITSLTEVLRNMVLSTTHAQGASVLLIDHDEAIGEYHNYLLTEFGFDVRLCTSADEAISAFNSSDFDLVITELSLGDGGHGQQVIQEIRRYSKKSEARIPIMVCSSEDLAKCHTGLLYLGINDFVEKNILPNQLCLQAARAIRQYRTEKLAIDQANQFRHNSMYDELTKVYNRNGFTDIGQRFVASCSRKKTPLGVIFIDLDHFKPVNDSLGHAVGDQVLVNIAMVLLEQTRDQDMVVRWGGDEFVLVLYDCDPNFLRIVAERIKKALKDVAESLHGVTASMGLINGTPQEFSELNDLLDKADKALYQSKKQGRDQIVEYKSEE